MSKKSQLPIEKGQYYQHNRGQIYKVEYVNSDVLLLYDGKNYRLERLNYFRSVISSGMFELKPDMEINNSEAKIDFSQINQIGEKGIESLEKAGLTTPKDFSYKDDEIILELDHIGESGLQNIKDWIKNNEVKQIEI